MNDPTPETPGHPLSLAERVVELGTGVSVLLGQRLESLGLTPGQVRVLRIVEQRAGLSQRALASRLGVAASRVAKLVGELEDQGLLERPRRGTDRRRSELYLTANGAIRIMAAREALRELDGRIGRALADEEFRTALVLLGKLSASVAPGPPQRDPPYLP